jgi:hypothetical protein
MICPNSRNECDNPGCRHGGCQGRLPPLPLFQTIETATPTAIAGRAAPRPDGTSPSSRSPLWEEAARRAS